MQGILKISEDRMKHVEELYRKGISKITSTVPHGRTVSHKHTVAYGWFKRVVDCFGDYMPQQWFHSPASYADKVDGLPSDEDSDDRSRACQL